MNRTKTIALVIAAAASGAALVFAVTMSSHDVAPSEEQATTPKRAASTIDVTEKNEPIAVLRREQSAMRDDLARAIDATERQMTEAKDPAKAKALQLRRDALDVHLDAIDTTPDEGWDALKARIDRALAEQSG